jgi:hypothetical protein
MGVSVFVKVGSSKCRTLVCCLSAVALGECFRRSADVVATKALGLVGVASDRRCANGSDFP